MAKIKRTSRKPKSEAVEKTPFLRFIDKVTSLWKVYAIILGVIVVLGGAFVIWYYIDQNTQNKAAKELAIAQKELTDKTNEALEKDPDNVDEEALVKSAIERYGEIADKYPRTSAGKLARFRIASGQFQIEKYDDARENYEKLLKEKSIIGILSEMGLGDCYRASGDKENAIKHYEQARDRCKDKEFPYIPITLHLADLYFDNGDYDKAEELYREIIDYHLYSPFAEDATEGLTEIKIKREIESK